jgi:hypothetical protein
VNVEDAIQDLNTMKKTIYVYQYAIKMKSIRRDNVFVLKGTTESIKFVLNVLSIVFIIQNIKIVNQFVNHMSYILDLKELVFAKMVITKLMATVQNAIREQYMMLVFNSVNKNVNKMKNIHLQNINVFVSKVYMKLIISAYYVLTDTNMIQ